MTNNNSYFFKVFGEKLEFMKLIFKHATEDFLRNVKFKKYVQLLIVLLCSNFKIILFCHYILGKKNILIKSVLFKLKIIDEIEKRIFLTTNI